MKLLAFVRLLELKILPSASAAAVSFLCSSNDFVMRLKSSAMALILLFLPKSILVFDFAEATPPMSSMELYLPFTFRNTLVILILKGALVLSGSGSGMKRE